MRHIALILALMILSQHLPAQTKVQTGWISISGNIQLKDRWGLYFNLLTRSSDRYENISSFQYRPGLVYQLNQKSSIAMGYLHLNTYCRLSGLSERTTEHQIFEQFSFKQNFKPVALSHRFRLGQRFFKQESENRFAQGCQYMLRAMIPTANSVSSFEKGTYLAIQNEVFLNVQNKKFLNGSHFGQNRAFAAFGYRLNPKLDIEAGYLHHAIKGKSINTQENTMQLAVLTRF